MANGRPTLNLLSPEKGSTMVELGGLGMATYATTSTNISDSDGARPTLLRRSPLSLSSYFVLAALAFAIIAGSTPYHARLAAGVPFLQPYGLLALLALPIGILLWGARKFYNCSYTIQEDEIIARQGSLGYEYRVTRVRFSEIKYTRVCQTVFQRILGYGDLCIFTTNHDCPDLKLYGIHQPQDASALIDKLQAAVKRKAESRD